MQIKGHSWKILAFSLPAIWLAIFVIFFYLHLTLKAQATDSPTIDQSASLVVLPPREKPPQQIVKGIYLTANSAANSKKMEEIISLIDYENNWNNRWNGARGH